MLVPALSAPRLGITNPEPDRGHRARNGIVGQKVLGQRPRPGVAGPEYDISIGPRRDLSEGRIEALNEEGAGSDERGLRDAVDRAI
jgi:hypothetical protein